MWISVAAFLKSWLPITLSLIALYVSLRDRRPRLLVRPRKQGVHNPYKLRTAADGHTAFVGGIEVYNLSGRPNAVRNYSFWRKSGDGNWRAMDSQNYGEGNPGDSSFVDRNPTPVTIAPYSGTEIRVLAFASLQSRPEQLQVRIEVEDLFGKQYHVEVTAERAT